MYKKCVQILCSIKAQHYSMDCCSDLRSKHIHICDTEQLEGHLDITTDASSQSPESWQCAARVVDSIILDLFAKGMDEQNQIKFHIKKKKVLITKNVIIQFCKTGN